jgi:hypothetical protein
MAAVKAIVKIIVEAGVYNCADMVRPIECVF